MSRREEFILPQETSGSLQENLEGFGVEFKNLTATWPSAETGERTRNLLVDVTFSASPGQLVVLVGQVGSGKVWLLNYLRLL